MKNKQIIMLALVFVISGVCGWFLESAIIGEEYKTADEVADEAAAVVLPELSTIPVVDTTVELKPVSNGTRYSLTANAFVESDDTLSYFLFENKECNGKCYEGKGGKFISIPGKADETYYLVVKNKRTEELSEVIEVSGFRAKLSMDARLTEKKLEDFFNGKAKLDRGWQDKQCSIVQLKADAFTIGHLSQLEKRTDLRSIANYMAAHTNLHADVSDIEYDADGKLKGYRLTITEKE
ncbi:MAG: hypothetical protein IKT59_07245 [Bacteroidales bacterium]|nr:hypothetical protein [Bacteroidales bacterium]